MPPPQDTNPVLFQAIVAPALPDGRAVVGDTTACELADVRERTSRSTPGVQIS